VGRSRRLFLDGCDHVDRSPDFAGQVQHYFVFARLADRLHRVGDATIQFAFQQFAAQVGQTPSRILRRLIREAITAGPDYFDDGLLELRQMRNEVGRVGGNLNQLVRTANQCQAIEGCALRRVLNAVSVQVEAVKEIYRRAELDGFGRVVVPPPEAEE